MAKKKKTLRVSELTRVNVPRMKMITVEQVLKIALENETIK